MNEKVQVEAFPAPDDHIADDPEERDERQERDQAGQRKHDTVEDLALAGAAGPIAVH